jgi:hypothetical protein
MRTLDPEVSPSTNASESNGASLTTSKRAAMVIAVTQTVHRPTARCIND